MIIYQILTIIKIRTKINIGVSEVQIRVKEAAKRLGLHPSRIRQLITEGKLPAIRHGKRLLLIKETDLNLIHPSNKHLRSPNLSNLNPIDLIDLINKQNSKIENLEKEILNLKQAFLHFGENLPLPPQISLPKNKEIISQSPSKEPDSTNSQYYVSKLRLEWLKANQQQYAGKYLGFNQENLVSIGITYKEAKENAIKAGTLNPFVVHVPDPKVIYEISW